jgi:hypothetical protein
VPVCGAAGRGGVSAPRTAGRSHCVFPEEALEGRHDGGGDDEGGADGEAVCALVPKPRKHLVTYHGVLAPAAGLRSRVVTKRERERDGASGCAHAAGGNASGTAGEPASASAAANPKDAAFRMALGSGTVVGGGTIRGRNCWCGCSGSTCCCARIARERGACWRRAERRRVVELVVRAATTVSRSETKGVAVTSRRSRRGIGVSGGQKVGCEGMRNGRE